MTNKMQNKFTLVNDEHLMESVLAHHRLIEHAVRPTMSKPDIARLWNEILIIFNAKLPAQKPFTAKELQSRWDILLNLIRTKESILQTLTFPGKMGSLIHRTIDELKKCEKAMLTMPAAKIPPLKKSAPVKTVPMNAAPVKTLPKIPPLINSAPLNSTPAIPLLINTAPLKPMPLNSAPVQPLPIIPALINAPPKETVIINLATAETEPLKSAPVRPLVTMPTNPPNRLQKMFRANMAELAKLPHATQVAALSEIIELLLAQELALTPPLLHPEVAVAMQECDNFFRKINLPNVNPPTDDQTANKENTAGISEKNATPLRVLSENGVVVKELAVNPPALVPFLITNVRSLGVSPSAVTSRNKMVDNADLNLGAKNSTCVETPVATTISTEITSQMQVADELLLTNQSATESTVHQNGSATRSFNGQTMMANQPDTMVENQPNHAQPMVENCPPLQFFSSSNTIDLAASVQKPSTLVTPVEKDTLNTSVGQPAVPQLLVSPLPSLPIETPQPTEESQQMLPPNESQQMLPPDESQTMLPPDESQTMLPPDVPLEEITPLQETTLPVSQPPLPMHTVGAKVKEDVVQPRRSLRSIARRSNVKTQLPTCASVGLDKQNTHDTVSMGCRKFTIRLKRLKMKGCLPFSSTRNWAGSLRNLPTKLGNQAKRRKLN